MAHNRQEQAEIHIREKTTDDIPFLRSLTARFAQVGSPPWRDPAKMWEFHKRSTEETVARHICHRPVGGIPLLCHLTPLPAKRESTIIGDGTLPLQDLDSRGKSINL